MTEGDGTTTGVKLFLGHTKLLHTVGSLGGEGLIDLELINLLNREASLLEGSRDGESGSDTHNLGRNTSHSERENAAVDLAAKLDGDVATAEKYAGSAIGDLGRVSSSGGTILLEGGLELAETRNSGLGTAAIVIVNENLLQLTVFVLNSGRVGSDFALGPSVLEGDSSLLVRLESHLILGGAIDTELFGDVLRGDTHGHKAVAGFLVLVNLLRDELGVNSAHHASSRHGLDTTADTHTDFTGGDSIGNSGDSLEAGGAEAVHALHAGSLGVASEETSHAGSGRSGTVLEHVTNDDILDHGLVNLGLGGDSLEDGLKHSFGSGVSLGSLLGAGHGSAGHTNDDNVVVALGGEALGVVEGCAGLGAELGVHLVNSLDHWWILFRLKDRIIVVTLLR
jgi:hypothetical protein